MKLDAVYDQLTGPCIREITRTQSSAQEIYLTFDDGPDDECTPKVLELLSRHQSKATFFIIGEKARLRVELVKQIIAGGHSIGDHTIDHDTKKYFSDDSGIDSWLTSSRKLLQELNVDPVGFRSPLGLKTPQLNRVLKTTKRPLVLWNVRFYDTKNGLTRGMVDKKLNVMKSGSIILLHDTHRGERQVAFLDALEHLLVECKKNGLEFAALSEKCIVRSYQEKYEA